MNPHPHVLSSTNELLTLKILVQQFQFCIVTFNNEEN